MNIADSNGNKWIKEIHVWWSEDGKRKEMFISCWSNQLNMTISPTGQDADGKPTDVIYRAIIEGFKHSFRLEKDEYDRINRELKEV